MAIRKLDPSARFKLICEYDTAIVPETDSELADLRIGKQDADGNEILNPTRYQQYLENLDESKLKFREGETPNYFIVRCLTNDEMGGLQERYFDFDPKAKKPIMKGSKTDYFKDLFSMGCIGMEEGDQVAKVTSNEIGYGVMVSIGSSISIFTQLSKHAKKS